MKSSDANLTAQGLDSILKIHDRLRGGGRHSRQELADLCECSTRTVSRYVDFLRDRFRAPIPSPAPRDGYHYTDKFDLAGEVPITEGELLAFMVAQRVVESYGNLPFVQDMRAALSRLSQRMGGVVRVGVDGLVDRSYQVDSGPIRQVAPEVWLAVERSLRERRPLRLRYRSLSKQEVTERTVEPYVLKNHRGDWYLLAWCRKAEDLRMFALSRILHVDVKEDEVFHERPDVDVEAHFRSALSIFAGEKPERVRIHFSARAARWILERRWHESQKAEPQPDGSVILELEVAPTLEVVRWVLAHGEDAEALEPPALVEEVERHMRAVCARMALTSGSRA